MAGANTKKASKPDLAGMFGIVVALAGILGGLLLEGGKVGDILQFTAAMIVLGGTIGAVMVSTPLKTLIGSQKRLAKAFLDGPSEKGVLVEEIIGYASKARKMGLVSLEQDADHIADPFLRKALTLAVDGSDLQEIRKMLDLQIGLEEALAESEAKVFESAGGYAPTIGIIGAVLGLIQVMKNLANIEEVGHGIAVAFVATVYGVGTANLFFLPVAAKIKARAQEETERKELIVEGVCGIVEGLNPKLLRTKIEAYVHGEALKKPTAKKEPADASAAAAEAPEPQGENA